MSANSKIEWTHHTFNAWWGCAKVSPGCDNCYAERDAGRYFPGHAYWGVDAERREFSDRHWAEPRKWNAQAAKSGNRVRVFCSSMADVFDKNAPAGARERLWALIKDTPNLDWLVLTKRIGNAARMLPTDWLDGYQNVWLGISVVNQEEADRDIPKLLATPAFVRWLSMEPLLGPVDISRYVDPVGIHCREVCPDSSYVKKEEVTSYVAGNESIPYCQHCGLEASWTGYGPGIDWVVVGGESGPAARPMHTAWAESIRDRCAEGGAEFLFKQWGEWRAYDGMPTEEALKREPRKYRLVATDAVGSSVGSAGSDGAIWMHRVGKKAAGRLLAAVEHNGYPEP